MLIRFIMFDKIYDSHKYHSDKRYTDCNRKLSELRDQVELKDSYTNETLDKHSPVNLDHIISAKEIDSDASRYLAELDGAELANDHSNLTPTHQAINKSKNADTMSIFIESMDYRLANKKEKLNALKDKLNNENLSVNEKQKLEKEIRNLKFFWIKLRQH